MIGVVPLVGTATIAMAPTASAAPGTLSFVASTSNAGNRTSHPIQIPAAVHAGDRLVLFLTTNSTTTTVNNTVAGWTLLQSVDGNGTRGRAWTKAATATDAGSNVTVTTSAATKSVISIAAYRSLAGPTATASTVRNVDTSASSHDSPTVAVTQPNSWLVNVWSEKSSVSPTWTVPGTVTQRSTAVGTGSGEVGGVLGDSNGVVPVGTAAARTATTSAAVGRSIEFSVVIAPGDDPGPVNHAPTAAFSSNCTDLACDFDATASADSDGDTLTYAWTFGDAGTGAGASPSHTYATAGNKTVTLTVSDGLLTNSVTHTAAPTTPSAAQADLSYVGSATTSGNRASHPVVIPAGVHIDDQLLLFMTTNSTAATITTPDGWTLLQSIDGNGTRGRLWSRQASATDAGTTVTITSSATVKSVLTVGAYRSTGVASVSASAIRAVDTAGTSATTPTVAVANQHSWLVNFWSEKSSATSVWTLPAGTTSRSTGGTTGSGKVSGILGDSGAPVPTGTAAGRTA
ncbi:MAG: domain containing protein, partial [Marmoricola sp.]|nr:domain containing protein [Marmoricola sp.]